MRYLRAFIRALQLTASGESLTLPHFRPLEAWIVQGLEKLDRVEQIASENGLSADQQELIQLKIDGHNITMRRILLMVRHNFQTEYPRLIKLADDFSTMVIQSSNFNDQYRVQRLFDSEEMKNPSVHAALGDLSEHLYHLPEIKNPSEA